MVKILKGLAILIALIGLVFSIGPKVKYSDYTLFDNKKSLDFNALDAVIADQEAKIKNLKPNNHARIIWADSMQKDKTEYCLLYLHGFSASHMEGDPIHRNIASRYGMNLYLPRLADHGRMDSTTFMNLTPDQYIQSAEDALEIAKMLGDKVIVMSCSTGGTLSLILAAGGANIHSLIMYSPNIDIYDPMSELVLYPWGKQLSSLVMKGDYNRIQYTPEAQKYWNTIYHMNGVFAVKYMTKHYMNSVTFNKVKQPVFLGYYYKDEENQDKVVSVKRALECFDQLGTPSSAKTKVAFPEAGHHVISSDIMSPNTSKVAESTIQWMEKTLGILPKK
jgi:esterase/lipase